MLSPFSWLRARVRTAILEGVGDALTVLDADGSPVTIDIPEALAAKLRPALPSAAAPAEEIESNGAVKRRKAPAA